jgi:hypothetical protein
VNKYLEPGSVIPKTEHNCSVLGITLPGSNYFVQLWVKTFSGYLIVPYHLFRKTCVVSELEISSFCVELTFLDQIVESNFFGSGPYPTNSIPDIR